MAIYVWHLCAPLFFLAAAIGPVSAEPVERNRIQMSRPEQDGAGTGSIDGGDRLDPRHWPATLKFNVDGQFTCTSTIIGQRVIITAAHCVHDGAVAEIDFGENENSVIIDCERHPRFQADTLTNDVALCASRRDFPESFSFESIDSRVTRVRRETQLFLVGYGCRDIADIGNPDLRGQLYGGLAPVKDAPVPPDDHFKTQGGLVLCRGDSGGAAYVLSDNQQASGPRSIVGINSGNIRDLRISGITPLSGSLLEYIRDWTEDRKLQVCGLHPGAHNCRDRFAP